MSSGEVRMQAMQCIGAKERKEKVDNSTVTSFLVDSSLCFKPLSN